MEMFLLLALWTALVFPFPAFGSSAKSWHKYVRAPSSPIVAPRSILHTAGTVHNATALLTNASDGQKFATLQRAATNSPVPSITIDFGQDVVGFVEILFAGASANHPGIRLAFSETTKYLTNVSDFTRSDNGDTITPGTDQYAVPSMPTNWTDTHGCLYEGSKVCADGLHGFRYMRISLDSLSTDAPYTQPNGTVHIYAVRLHWYAFLGTPETYTGFFECSDTNLTQWWFDAVYTNEMITAKFTANTSDPRDANSPSLDGMQVLQDGAKRDRDPYAGDLAASARTAYLSHSHTSNAAKTVLGDLADHQRSDGWIPPASIDNYTLPLFDYPLWWVVNSWEYVLFTGDQSYAEQYWSNLEQVLNVFYPSVTNKSSGLLSKGLGGTVGYGDYAFLPRTGEVTYYNALYVFALQNAAAWASNLSHLATSSTWRDRAKSVANAININLWDSDAGAYLDSANLSTSYGETRHAQDGNGIAVLTGIAPQARANSSLTYLSSHTQNFYGNAFYDGAIPNVDNATERVYAFISFFELQGRFLTHGFQLSAIEEIKRLYGWMSVNDPTITVWEGIGPGGSPYEQGYTSMAHGWSTGIVSLMSNYVLGVWPSAPGFSKFSVQPRTAGLEWADGQVATPRGPITVSWTTEAEPSKFSMKVGVPSGTVANISVPAAEGDKITVDGQARKAEYIQGYLVLGELSSGAYTIDVV